MNNAATTASVLLVDDDEELCTMLSEYLAAEQFEVTAVHNGQDGVDSIRAESFDAVVMDITMPVLDGFDALRQVRTFSTVPVLMLTARGDETDRIVGLEIGADDYLPKPFNPRELSARLKAILRRARLPAEQGGNELQVAGLTLTGTQYTFAESSRPGSPRWVVLHFFALPGGKTTGEMSQMQALAADFMSTFQRVLEQPEYLNLQLPNVVRRERGQMAA